MFKDNLANLRKLHDMTQEELAEKINVSRQSIAKWESGDSVPDLEKCKLLSEIFGVSLDDLANYEAENNMGINVPPKGKHLFGIVRVGEKGQIVIPAKARKTFDIKVGDSLVVLGDEAQGIALIKGAEFLKLADMIRNDI